MPLRRSPVITPASLAARRANALKSTGPRTARGKAWTCLNALRHGRRARQLREKIERTGDPEALFLLDWFYTRLLYRHPHTCERGLRHTLRLAGRVWCFMTGRSLLPRLTRGVLTRLDLGREPYRYSDSVQCPPSLWIGYKSGRGIFFRNPTPTRRRHLKWGWLPEVAFLPGKLPRVRRVRDGEGAGPRSGLALHRQAAWAPGAGEPHTPDAPPAGPGVSPTPPAAGRLVSAAWESSPERSQAAEDRKRVGGTNLECSLESVTCYDSSKTPLGRPQRPAQSLGPEPEAAAWYAAREASQPLPGPDLPDLGTAGDPASWPGDPAINALIFKALGANGVEKARRLLQASKESGARERGEPGSDDDSNLGWDAPDTFDPLEAEMEAWEDAEAARLGEPPGDAEAIL
ncbi:MAG TPA: hypothetical protein VL523_15695, partial [Terriglobia bacterium]|nr:hypothetical protein [Terriglobia bacterium]